MRSACVHAQVGGHSSLAESRCVVDHLVTKAVDAADAQIGRWEPLKITCS
jgi:hypothetical protein